ncbi:hypothetical protein DVH24_010899 [Malus domestica]|uniref:NAC domain-containing protein n=1 Tax=Malus domestica TaxID=3750 RepID=A0A498JXS3_MALDO|nr:protein SOMBRERO-like [Malus domestica]RXH98574.1 hypothetical protein DVH24_010899 [Malus domestica]
MVKRKTSTNNTSNTSRVRVRVRVESDKDEEILGTNKLELRKLKRIREEEESLKISFRLAEELERQELERLACVSSSFAACRLEIRAAEIFRKQAEALKKRELEKRLISLGYTFNPDDGILLHHHLREKCLENALGFYAILEEADIYAKHPQNLIENYRALAAGNVGYFFTRSRPNETQPHTSTSTDHVQAGHWIFGKELDVLHQGEKVGVKQLLEYCAAGAKTGYKIIEYRLDPCPDNLKDGPWFLCKLYKDGSYMEVQSSL